MYGIFFHKQFLLYLLQRDDVKNSTAFQHILTKYFSVNTLHTVCPWLADMVSLDVSAADQTPASPSFTYRAPLPHISKNPLSTFIQVSTDLSAANKVFNLPIGFFWETVETDEGRSEQDLHDDGVDYDTQNTVSLVYKKVYRDPHAMMGILNRVIQEGLDLAGLRLLYPTVQMMSQSQAKSGFPGQLSKESPKLDTAISSVGPVLALALRGTYARVLWLEAVGPSDPVLARHTDPKSLCALYGGASREECLLFCPRNPVRAHSELCRWFGGRVPDSGVIDIGACDPDNGSQDSVNQRNLPSGKHTKHSQESNSSDGLNIPCNKPAATLTASTSSDVFLVMSPWLPPRCLGLVLSTCQRRGYQLRGVRRGHLNSKKARILGN